MAIHESGEDYLEAILMIKKRSGNVRSIDVARELSFSKPSVSVAMKNLKTSNYITVDENGFINLTEAGQAIADKIYERHTFLTNWLTSMGVDPEVAAEDACKMEHAISSESFSAIKKFVADTH
ncbi:metal-dependent transcriptional regulator [Blautia difficilis]|uniref:Metal-dependent transcriptional regulator n=1 Tax=Blautia difficilis TaxID=2763027 RepID=A0ABR7IK79_9FIRM|nr:metal-dependent transcriptional regulator [Blautia difficilis]MBC5780213.1 metal-dependent transcriptional regulator [Blautia difficilis]